MPLQSFLQNSDSRIDQRTGAPVRIHAELPLPQLSGDASGVKLTDAVRGLLQEHAAELKLNVPARDFELKQDVETPARRILRYRQRVAGIPVFEADVVVQVSKDNVVKQVDVEHPIAGAKANVSGAAKLSAAEALSKAQADTGNAELRVPAQPPSQTYLPTDTGLRLAYHVLLATKNPPHDWSILIDAETGVVLKKDDILKKVDGHGKVFDPNPVVTAMNNALRSPKATSGPCGFAGSSVATIDAQQVTRPLRDLTLAGGKYSLEGPYAKMVALFNPAVPPPTETNPANFNYNVGDNRFEPVNSYYHIDTIQRYIQSIGITNANNRQTGCDAHDAPTGGAFYSQIDKMLHLGGTGPCDPDRGQDGDCMTHEYGHAIQDNQVPGWGGVNPGTGRYEASAMGEGFGDILACTFFAPDFPFQREVFEDWCFASSALHGLRRVDGIKTYDGPWSGDEHANGEIWSAALWNIYRAIGGDSMNLADRYAGRDTLLKSLILSHFSLPTNGSMPDGAEALMKTHAELDQYRGKYLREMLDSFHARHILLCNSAADLYMKRNGTDTGVDSLTGPVFWDSPDLWIRNADDNATTHQNVVTGHDNFFYARVHNKGTATARAFVVTFNVKPFAGVQFLYPNDFVPFISAAVGFNLAPGASTVVKAKWPAAMVPAAGVHACWVASIYTPTESSPAGRHVWEAHELAQKNLTIIHAASGDTLTVPFEIGNLANAKAGLYRLEVRRPAEFAQLPISLVHPKADQLAALFQSVPAAAVHVGDTVHAIAPTADLQAKFVRTATEAAIQFNPGELAGFPFRLPEKAQSQYSLRVTVPAGAKRGDQIMLQVMQRDAQGQVVGGISIQVNVDK